MTERFGFRDVKSEVFERIRNNVWGPGALLPSEVELAAEFSCARATVNRAMQELMDDGIIDRRRKGGSRVKLAPTRQVTFQIPLVRKEIEASGAAYGYKLISRKLESAPLWLQKQWRLGDAAPVLHIQCLHSADDRPFQFEDRWINLHTVPRAEAADFKFTSPNEWLVSEVPYTTAEVRFSAAWCEGKVAKYLLTETGAPVFQATRMTWLSGKPVTFVRLSFAKDYEMVARY